MTDQIEVPDTPRNRAIYLHNQALAMHDKAAATGKNDPGAAYRMFASSVDVDPTFTEGWYACGNANGDMFWRDAAVACFRRALEIDPKDAKALCNLGHRLYELGRHEEAKHATLLALKYEPTLPFAWSNLSLIQRIEGDTEAAIRSAAKGFELEPETHTEMALAFACLFGRQWMRGLLHFEARFDYKLKTFVNFPFPRWHGEDLDGKTLFLTAEQGMGDALSYLRFVPLVAARGGQIYLSVQPELVRMAAQMLHDKTTNVLVGPLHPNLPPADYWCSLTSVPLALGLTDEEFENTPAMPVPWTGFGATTPWKTIGRRLHVGICWAGAPQNDIDRFRAVKVTDFLELYKCSGIQLYSLQVGDRARDIYDAGCQPLIKDLAPFIRDTADTAAIIRDLDLVITVETSVGHIAGAVEADCWVLYSRDGGDYRLGFGDRGALWYPRTRIFKQGADGQWGPVWGQVVAALKQRMLV